MIWFSPILICATPWGANAVPTGQSEVSQASNSTSKVLLKRQHGRVWKPLNNRHHQWQFPKNVDCSPYKDVFGFTGYDGDYLMKESWEAAQQIYNPYNPADCNWKVECYRAFYTAYADKSLTLTMEFKVKDEVKNVGQEIQFSLLYITKKGVQFAHYCTHSADKKSWLQVQTGNQGHEFGRLAIDPPSNLN